MEALYKESLITLEVSPNTKEAVRSDVTFWSYDINTARQRIQLTKDGTPLVLNNLKQLTLVLQLIQRDATIHLYPEIECAEDGLVSMVLPIQTLGYDGEVKGGLFIQYSNQQSLDCGYFIFCLKTSSIDHHADDIGDFYVQRFEQLQMMIEQKAEELLNGLDTDYGMILREWEGQEQERQENEEQRKSSETQRIQQEESRQNQMQEVAGEANTYAEHAKTQGDYAQEQGGFAQEQGGFAQTKGEETGELLEQGNELMEEINEWYEALRSSLDGDVAGNLQNQIHEHKADENNPHSVTKAQVGLGNADNTADSNKNVLSAAKLTTARSIGLSGVTATSQSFDATDNVNIPITAVPASLMTGMLEAARLPAASTTAAGIVQLNNTLTGTSTTQALTAAQGKALQDAVTQKAPASHSHSGGDITTGTVEAARLPSASTTAAGIVQLNNTLTSESTTQALTAEQGRSLAEQNMMAWESALRAVDDHALVDASTSRLGHVQLSNTIPASATTNGSAGSWNGTVANADHAHPAQTSITGNAASASKLQTARTINGVAFNGTGNITVPTMINLLWEGSWKSGSIFVSQSASYTLFLVRGEGRGTMMLAIRSGDFIRGIGGYLSTTPTYTTYHFAATILGSTLTWVAEGQADHRSASNYHTLSTNTVPIVEIYGIR